MGALGRILWQLARDPKVIVQGFLWAGQLVWDLYQDRRAKKQEEETKRGPG